MIKTSLNFLFEDDTLSPRERVLMAINHEEPDRVPITELSMDSMAIAKYYGSKTSLTFSKTTLKSVKYLPGWRWLLNKGMQSSYAAKMTVKGLIDLYYKMGFDIVFIPLVLLPSKGHDDPNWKKKVLPDPFHYVDEFGRLFQFVETRYGMIAYYRGGILKTPELYDDFGPIDPEFPLRMHLAESAIKLTKNKAGNEFIFPVPALTGVVESTWQGMGLTSFSKYIRKDREFIKRIIADHADLTIRIAKNIKHLDFPAILIYDDYGYKTGPFMSPKNFQELIYPELKRIVDEIHGLGKKVFLHSCGNLNEIIDQVVDSGIDVLHPIEPTASMNIFELKKKYGDKLTLMGNVSPQDLQDKDPNYIRAYVQKLMAEIPKNGGYIFSSGHSINPAVGVENYLAMRDEFKKFAYYKKR